MTAPYTIGWYDAERTILLCKVTGPWTWDDAARAIQQLNALCHSVSHGVYTIFLHTEHGSFLPQGRAIPTIKSLIDTDQPNDELIFFVGISRLASVFLNIAEQMYDIRKITAKYRFVTALEIALADIERHKNSRLA